MPAVVTGEPATVRPVGTVIDTDVTVPVLHPIGVKYSSADAPVLTLSN